MGYKLKPCPFCGGQAELDSKQAFREFVSGKISDAVAVYCTKCSAEISVCVPDVPDIQPEQLVDMWNTQSPVEDLSALVQRLVRHFAKPLQTMSCQTRLWNTYDVLVVWAPH